MQIAATDLNTTTYKVRQPDFGLMWRNKQTGEFIRIGHTQYLALHKVPVDNCIPTKLAALGIVLEPEEYKTITKIFLQHEKYGQNPEHAIDQIIQIKKLLAIKFPVRKAVLRYYPFCQIDLLTPDQLAFMNVTLKTDIEYDAYVLFMTNLFTEEFLRPVFLQEGVSDVPTFTFGAQSQTNVTANEDADLKQSLLELIRQQK